MVYFVGNGIEGNMGVGEVWGGKIRTELETDRKVFKKKKKKTEVLLWLTGR